MRKFYRLDGGKMCECADDAGPIVLFSKPTSDEQRELTSTWGIDEHDLASALDPDEIAHVVADLAWAGLRAVQPVSQPKA